ncbi:hypothetical protein [Salmonella phage SE3]|uniref:Uncharacterized protein n=1 Tax=Salmonella phage SE3 TaxID=2575327 RepID=A0A5B9N4R2_9CAUD|nr:hypothetical protein [Salmonella phage SE3]QEI25126.1 class I SAM-dependent methyltransferase [Salmonella phage SE7]
MFLHLDYTPESFLIHLVLSKLISLTNGDIIANLVAISK